MPCTMSSYSAMPGLHGHGKICPHETLKVASVLEIRLSDWPISLVREAINLVYYANYCKFLLLSLHMFSSEDI